MVAPGTPTTAPTCEVDATLAATGATVAPRTDGTPPPTPGASAIALPPPSEPESTAGANDSTPSGGNAATITAQICCHM